MKKKIGAVAIVLTILLSSNVIGAIIVDDGYDVDLWFSDADLGRFYGVKVGLGGAFGNDPYVAAGGTDSIIRVTGQGVGETFASGLNPIGRHNMAFDPSGLFGGDMFVSSPGDGGGGVADPVYRINSSGEVSIFYSSVTRDLLTNGIAFGHGNGFGNDLYVPDVGHGRLVRFKPSGYATALGAEYSGQIPNDVEADLLISPGGAFGNYAYYGNKRMSPDGIVETLDPIHNGSNVMAFGKGVFGENLYYGTSEGNIYYYTPSGENIFIAGGFGARIRGMDITDDALWFTVDGGGLYKITTVPEPATLLLLGLGGVILRKKSKL